MASLFSWPHAPNLPRISPCRQVSTPPSEFTMSLYSKHHDCTTVKDIGDLRWFLFSKHSVDAEKLPPTWGALKQHILRAHYVSSTWVRCVHGFNPALLNPTNCGWATEAENLNCLIPVMTEELPAPEATIDMVSCKCTKTKCVSGRCRGHTNNLRCSELCQCENCENSSEFVREDMVNDDDNSDI